MKLSDLDPKDVTSVKKAGGLKLSDLHPDQVTPVSKASDSSDLKDLGIGLGQGATLGFGDELLGGAQAAGDVLSGDTNLEDILSSYRKHQKENEAGVDAAHARSPYLVTGGELAGGLIPAFLSGGTSETASGAQVAKTLAQLAKSSAVTGAKIGGLAGLGNSHATIENDPGQLLKDTGTGVIGGAVVGGASPYLLAGGKAALSSAKELGAQAALGLGNKSLNLLDTISPDFIKDKVNKSQFIEKLLYTMEKNIDGSQEFSGKNAGPDIINQLKDTAQSMTDQFMDPIKQSSQYYGDTLKSAGDQGSKISSTNPNYINSIKNLLPNLGNSDGEQALKTLLEKHGNSYYDPMTMNQVNTSLTPQEGKTAQNLARSLYDPNSKESSNLSLKDFINQSKPALDQSLPEGTLADINSKFGAPRDIINGILNKGEIDPEYQLNHVSDLDSNDIAPKIKNYFQNNLLPNLETGKIQGDKSQSALNGILDNVKNINELNQTQFVDPKAIQKQAKDAAMKYAIRKDISGEAGASQSITNPAGIMGLIRGKALQATEYGAQGIRNLNSIASGQKLFQASDAELDPLIKTLNENGHTDIARHLSNAISTGDNASKRAALFTIMTNPNYKKTINNNDNGDSN